MAITLVVEDGTGLDNANSYATDAEFKTYFKDRGIEIDFDTSRIIAGLIEATIYVDLRWGRRFKATPLVDEQALEFPRNKLRDRYGKLVEGLPADIKNATILYAKEWLEGTLYPTPPSGNSKDLKKKKTVVGPITTEVEYQGTATASTYLSFPLADRLCKLYTNAAGGTARN